MQLPHTKRFTNLLARNFFLSRKLRFARATNSSNFRVELLMLDLAQVLATRQSRLPKSRTIDQDGAQELSTYHNDTFRPSLFVARNRRHSVSSKLAKLSFNHFDSQNIPTATEKSNNTDLVIRRSQYSYQFGPIGAQCHPVASPKTNPSPCQNEPIGNYYGLIRHL